MKWIRTHRWLVLALLLAALAGRMLLTNRHFYTHDDIQVFRVHEYVQCLKEGQIPCRWASELGKGFGYPWFNYYPPMIYILPSLLNLAGLSIIASLNLSMFVSFLLAAWTMYLLAKELTKSEELAFLGSLLFTLYPFHAINVFVRGVYAENLAWSFAPLLLLVTYRQAKSGRWGKWIAPSFAFIFLTHMISTFVLTAFAIGWVVVIAFIYKQNILKVLSNTMLQIAIGVGMAAFFLIPAIAEKNLVQSDSLTQGYFAYTNHYVSFFQLFKEYKWNYEGSMWNEAADEMPFMVGHIHTALLGFGVIVVLASMVRRGISLADRKRLYIAVSNLIAAATLLLLAHFKSDTIWAYVAALAYVQFPWRFVVWAGIPLILTNVLLLSYLKTKRLTIVVVLISCALIWYSYPFFFPKTYDSYSDADLITGSQRHEQQSKSLYDYLPITVERIPDEYADESVLSDDAIKSFYFPGLHATVDGLEVPLEAGPMYGLARPVRPVEGTVVLSWRETPFRRAMDLLSLVSIVGYGFYLWKSHVQ